MTEQLKALDALIEGVEAGTAKHKDFAAAFGGYTMLDNLSNAYSGSLDAFLWLRAALLPGWEIRVHSGDGSGWANVWRPEDEGDCDSWCRAHTPARAGLLAILRAYRGTLA